jgi:hypothetical protein
MQSDKIALQHEVIYNMNGMYFPGKPVKKFTWIPVYLPDVEGPGTCTLVVDERQ